MEMKLKTKFFEWELDHLRGGNHGGLKFIVEDEKEQRVGPPIYRVTLSGGLDAANTLVDKQETEQIYSVSIYKRYGEKRNQWTKAAYLEREQGGLFNH